MINFVHYSRGGAKTGVGFNYKVPKNNDFIWMILEKPSDAEIAKVSKDFAIPKKYFTTYHKELRSRRYSTDPLVFTYIDYFVEKEHVRNIHVMIILTKNSLIITMPQFSKFHSFLFESLSETFEKSKNKSLAMLMYQFMLDDASENYDVLEEVHERIIELEESVLKAKNGHLLNDIVKIKRGIHKMSRRFWGTARIISLLRKGLTPLEIDKETMGLLDDLYETYMHQIDILRAYREVVSDALTIYTTNISNKLAAASNSLNIIVKRLTAITVIIMVPTLIAGIYGMNFDIPEFRLGAAGYYGALMAMILSIILLVAFFKYKDWM